MTREQRREQIVKALTDTLFKLGCKDTDRAIEAFTAFVETTLDDEFDVPDECSYVTLDAIVKQMSGL